MRTPRVPAAGVVALVLFSIVGAAALVVATGCRSAPRQVTAVSAETCADCHRDIAAQWAHSPHAEAWTDPAFVKASHGRKDEACLPCHAPEPLLERAAGERPVLRAEKRHLGVECDACHRLGCEYAGPYGGLAPHPTRALPDRFCSNGLCASCHQREAEQYDSLYAPHAEDRRTCAGCHMGVSVDRLTQGSALSLLHPKRRTRDHTFATWKSGLAKDAIVCAKPSTTREGDAVRVSFELTNTGAGHRIPTGEHGYREVRIRVVLEGTAGSAEAEDGLVAELADGLEPGVPRAFDVDVDAGAVGDIKSARVVVERVDEAGAVLATFVDRTWPL